ncbi:MAG TPA: hypothetical protein VGR08_11435 [Thermomicrobiales bacterium]|nr:hypothetical protein [Thermomicrobiales bacterium]
MHPLEFDSIVIDAHRRYLRDLFDPHALPAQGPSRRERLGSVIVRFGHWVAKSCPEITAVSAGDPLPGLTHP